MENDRKKIILLVEDEALIAMAEKKSLEKFGYNILTSYSGEEAINVYSKNKIDLILMDIDLGKGIDGTEAAEIILKDNDIPVVFLSSHTEPEIVEKTEKITSYGYVVKNTGATVLDASIKMAFKLFEAKMKEREKDAGLQESENRYRLLFETTISGFALLEMIYDNKGSPMDCRYIDVNPAHEKLTGLISKDIIGKTARESIPGLEDSWIENYSRVDKTGEPSTIENYVEGLNKWFKVYAYRPKPGYVAVTFEDITKRKRTEKELHESEEKFRVLYDSSPDMYVSVSPDDASILFCNETLLKKTGYSREEVIGSPIYKMYHEDCMEKAKIAFEQFAEKGEIRNRELILKRKNGSKIEVSLNVNSVKNETGKILHSISSWRDITERKQTEKALMKSEETVRKKLQVLREQEEDVGELNLDDIINAEELQTMMDDFYNTTNMGSAILDLSGKVLVAVGWQEICTKFHRVHPDSLQYCLESDTVLASGVSAGSFKAYRCKNNLWDMVTPIEVGGRHMGNIYLGQFFYDDEVPDYNLFRNQARQYGFDETEYLAALDKVPRWSREKVDTTMSFCAKMANVIANQSYSSIQISRVLSEKEMILDELHESEGRFRSIVRDTEAGYFFIDKDGIIRDVNEAWTKMYKYSSAEEIIGKHFATIQRLDDVELAHEFVAGIMQGNEKYMNGEFSRRCHDGSEGFHSFSARPVIKHDVVTGIEGFIIDITKRKHAEDALEKSSQQNKDLLRELQHRAKNSFNMISSMVSLAETSSASDEAKTALMEIGSRIKAVTEMYDLLYSTDSIIDVHLDEYLSRVASSLRGISKKITFENKLDAIIVAVKTAIPLGIITAELITNSFKHAFPANKKGKIILLLKKSNIGAIIEVNDNGKGLPDEFNISSIDSLGLQLVHALAEQVDGSFKIESKKGTKCVLEFPVE